MKFTAIIFTLNEENNIRSVIRNLKDVDEIIVIDHGSTDNTVEYASRTRANVYVKQFPHIVATADDINAWADLYHYSPAFHVGDKIYQWVEELTNISTLASNDWILWIDADERISWDVEKVKKLCRTNDAIICPFIHSKDHTFPIIKLANREKTHWVCNIHSGITGFDRATKSNDMVITHHQDMRAYRSEYLGRLEYEYLKNPSSRICFYLAREYYFYSKYDKALRFFNLYVPNSEDETELSWAYVYMAASYWAEKQANIAILHALYAIKTNPYLNAPYDLMAQFQPEHRDQWKRRSMV